MFGSVFTLFLNPPSASAAIADGDGVTIYGISGTGSTTPKTRDYSESTDSFNAQADTVSGATPGGFAIKTSPIKTEAIAAYVASGTLRVMCFDGTNWSNDWSATVPNISSIRPVDISYESVTGNVMVMYSTNTATTNELAYRKKDGTKACGGANWDATASVNPVRTSGVVDWVALQSNSTNNDMVAIWADANRDLSAMTWDGSAWSNEPTAAISTDLAWSGTSSRSDVESFDVAIESVTGNIMIVFSDTSSIKYKRCTGGTASCTWQTTTAVPTVADRGMNIDLSSNPVTNEMVFGAVDDNSSDLSIGYWSGSAWTGKANWDTSTETSMNSGYKFVTANWMINGATTRSIIMYADNSSGTVDYFVGNGNNFGTANSKSVFSPTPLFSSSTRYYKSRKDPQHLNRVMLEVADSNSDLFAKHVSMSSTGVLTWSNSDGGAALATSLSTNTAGPFGFAYWQFVPTPAPSKINQDGYVFENDDQVATGGNTADGDTIQEAGNTPVTGVRPGERLTVRFHMRNTGVDPLTGSLGLFYDRNDGYFVKADDHSPPNTAAGNCTDTKYNCAVVDNAAGSNTGQYASMAFDRSGQAWASYYDATNTALIVAKYVGYGGSGCGASGSSAWSCTTVDKAASTNLGQHTSLGFDGAGNPWVSYYDATNTNLKLATLHTDTTSAGTGCGTGSTMWDCTTVDQAANATGTATSIAFTQTGNPGVSYTYDDGTVKGLKYATYVGSGGSGCATTAWTCIVVDSGSAAGIDSTSIQYDHAGNPWIAYYDKNATALNVANYVGGTNGTGCDAGSTAWTCTPVDDSADDGNYASLMFGATGNAWVSYYDATSSALKVATKGGSFGTTCTSSAWTCGTVDNTGTNTGQYTSLAQDASGKVIISYYDVTNSAMRVARMVGSSGNCTSAAWNCSAVDNTGTATGQFTSAATAPDGNLWVAYYDSTNTSLRAAQVTRGGEIIPSAGLAGTSPATIANSHADMSSVSDSTNQNDADCLTAGASWNNGVWGSGSEAQSNQTGGTNSILPAGFVAAQCTEVAFTLDTSHATPGATYRFILASSNSDRPDHGIWRGPASVAAYATLTMASTFSQRFSKDTNPSFPACDAATTWGCSTVQSTNSVGQYSSLAFDPAGRAWMSYYDSSNSAQRVAQYVGTGGTGCANTQWTCITMENQSGRTTGQFSSIAIGKDGTPWVAYRDTNTTYGGLKVAQRVSSGGTCASIGGSASWNCTVVDQGTLGLGTGQFTSIAMSSTGAPWISYYDNGNGFLKLATYVGSNGSGCGGQPSSAWSCYTIDQTGAMGQDSYLGFDASGTAWISYYDSTNAQLRVAQYVGVGGSGCSSSAWSCTSVETAGNSNTSMSFGINGMPYISFYDGTNSALSMAKYVGTGGSCSLSAAWDCTQIDNSAGDGQYSSIAFDGTGTPWISYYDSSNADLKVAKYVGSGGSCTSSAWDCYAVNTGGTVGLYTSLAFDHSGSPWISYYYSSGQDLKIAKPEIPTAEPMALETTPAGPRNARMDDGRYHMDNGLAPRSSTGDCSAVANDMGYCGVLNNDGFYDSLYMSPNERGFFLFNFKRADNTLPAYVQWTGQSSVAATSATMRLEIYNFTTKLWESVITNTDCAADSGCRLTGAPTGSTLADYYKSDGAGAYWIDFRVSQDASGSGGTFSTNAFIFAPTTDLLMRHGQWFDPSGQLADRSQPFFWSQ